MGHVRQFCFHLTLEVKNNVTTVQKIEKEKFLNCNFDCCHTFELMTVKFQFLKLQSPFTISSDRLFSRWPTAGVFCSTKLADVSTDGIFNAYVLTVWLLRPHL